MPQTKHTFEAHLRDLKFPKKFNNHHDLQHALLKLNPHSVAFFDEFCNAVMNKRSLHKHFYPPINVEADQEHAKHYHGHTHSAIAIARRHRELVGSGFGGSAAKFVVQVGEHATKVGKWVLSKGKKVFQTVGKLVLKAGKWVADNPRLAAELINLGINTVGMIKSLATGGEPKGMDVEHVTEKEIKSITEAHRGAVSSLLADDDTDDEDEKAPPKETKKEEPKPKPEDKSQKKGGRLSTRFMI